MAYDHKALAAMAPQRARTYDRIIGVLMALPDPAFLEVIRSDESRIFLDRYASLNHPSIVKGNDLIKKFVADTMDMDEKALLELLAVDRTRLIRTPFKKAYEAPYEGQYSGQGQKKGNEAATVLALKRLYQSSGYAPVDTGETPDFFAVELDFLRVLILKMTEDPDKIPELVDAQKEFLENHPGNWISAYVQSAAPHAETDFYKGWLYFMEGFLELEKDYLRYIK